jgi:hypothetical protein
VAWRLLPLVVMTRRPPSTSRTTRQRRNQPPVIRVTKSTSVPRPPEPGDVHRLGFACFRLVEIYGVDPGESRYTTIRVRGTRNAMGAFELTREPPHLRDVA